MKTKRLSKFEIFFAGENQRKIVPENCARAELIVLASFSQAFIEETVSI